MPTLLLGFPCWQVAAIAVDTSSDFTYPGQDAGTRLLQPYLEQIE